MKNVEPQIPERFVAEITKNWQHETDIVEGLLSQRFELVIEKNRERGFELEDWKWRSVLMPNNRLCETIIAVFVRREFL